MRIAETLAGLAANAGVDNQAIGTCTVTDASPSVITVLGKDGITRTVSV